MNHDPFAPLSKKRWTIYATILAAVATGGITLMISLGDSPPRVVAFFLVATIVLSGFVGAGVWLSSGERSDTSVGPAAIKPPVRLKKAMPCIFAAVVLIQVLKLIEVLGTK